MGKIIETAIVTMLVGMRNIKSKKNFIFEFVVTCLNASSEYLKKNGKINIVYTVSKSLLTGRLARELKMVQPSATKCSRISIL
jgi:hypothetical protein